MIAMGQRVKARREELGLTQEDLAKKLGYSHKTSISRIESGTNEIPQSKMTAFADALNTSVGYLMGWTRGMNQRTGLSEDERQLISYFRAMNIAGRIALMAAARGLVDSGAYTEVTLSTDVG